MSEVQRIMSAPNAEPMRDKCAVLSPHCPVQGTTSSNKASPMTPLIVQDHQSIPPSTCRRRRNEIFIAELYHRNPRERHFLGHRVGGVARRHVRGWIHGLPHIIPGTLCLLRWRNVGRASVGLPRTTTHLCGQALEKPTVCKSHLRRQKETLAPCQWSPDDAPDGHSASCHRCGVRLFFRDPHHAPGWCLPLGEAPERCAPPACPQNTEPHLPK